VHFLSTPSVDVDDGGHIAVAWQDVSQGSSQIFIKHYNATDGWTTQELVASISQGYKIGRGGITVQTSSPKNSRVVWEEVLTTAYGEEHNIYVASQFQSGIISQPPDTQLPPVLESGGDINPGVSPSATWGSPENIWTTSLPNNTLGAVSSPLLVADDLGNAFVSVMKESGFNPQTDILEIKEQTLLHLSTSVGWVPDLPVSASEIEGGSLKIAIASVTGDAYVVWIRSGELFFNNYNANLGWATLQSMGPVNGPYQILSNSHGVATVVWQNSTNGTINARTYTPVGLQDVQNFTTEKLGAESIYIHPISIDDNGSLLVLLTLSKIDTTPLFPGGPPGAEMVTFIYSNTYKPETGWGVIESGPSLVSPGYPPKRINGLIHTAVRADGSAVMIMNLDDKLYASQYKLSAGWSLFENIDYNRLTEDMVLGDPQVAYNANGDVMVVWVEKVDRDKDGQFDYLIYSNRIAVADNNWGIPERLSISSTEEYEAYPVIEMDTSGHVLAIWRGNSITSSTLYASHYSPVSGWSLSPDKVVIYDQSASGKVVSPTLAVDNNGNMLLVWMQLLQSEFVTYYKIWVSNSFP